MGCQPGMLDLLLTPMDTTRHQSGDDGQCVMTPVDTSHSRVHVLSAGVMRLWGYLCFLPWGSLSWPESPLFPPLGGGSLSWVQIYMPALLEVMALPVLTLRAHARGGCICPETLRAYARRGNIFDPQLRLALSPPSIRYPPRAYVRGSVCLFQNWCAVGTPSVRSGVRVYL